VAVSAITPFSTSGISAANVSSAKSLYQPATTTQISTSKPYQVTLTGEALAKSLESQGFPVSFISAKLGLDLKTVDQYLGITFIANDALFKTTYSPPKPAYTPPKPTYTPPQSTYVAPKASYTEPQALTQNRASLASDLNQLSYVQYSASQLIDSATKKAA
jgi:hypothetical protein